MDSTEEKTLMEMAMLAETDADGELTGDFRKIRARIDRVVRSELADNPPPDGPVHAQEHTAALPDPDRTPKPENAQNEENRARLLGGSARFESPYVSVPRVVGA